MNRGKWILKEREVNRRREFVSGRCECVHLEDIGSPSMLRLIRRGMSLTRILSKSTWYSNLRVPGTLGVENL